MVRRSRSSREYARESRDDLSDSGKFLIEPKKNPNGYKVERKFALLYSVIICRSNTLSDLIKEKRLKL